MALVSLFLPKKTVGFEPPSLVGTESDSGSDTDSDNDGSKAMLKKALKMTTRHRMKQLIGNAVQLDRRNTTVVQDTATERKLLKLRRLTKMKSVGKQQLHIPRLADLVRTSNDKPIVKFRRMSRAVLLLIQVCNVCKDILSSNVRKEPWYALIDNLIAKSTMQQKSKAPRAFVTFVPNERRELVQLTFDVAEFKRERRTEFILTDAVREMMSILPGRRSQQQVAEIIQVMKALFPFFCHFKLATQKAIVQNAFFDKYKANRVIVKKGHHPDGIYFIMSGCVVEKHEGGKQPKIINAGEKFGEADLQCGTRRRHTVLTKVDTEIFYLHKQDYREIFHLSDDRNNPKNLDICRQHIVFQHFPMQRLLENPSTWSINTYKYGELISPDCNNVAWIYVIKSGEARVFKYLHPSSVDVKARRRKIQAQMNSQSPFYRKKRILNFVEERKYIKSAYRPATYHPAIERERLRLSAHSAPPSILPRQSTPILPRSCTSLPATRQGPRLTSSRKSSFFSLSEKPEVTLPRLVLEEDTADTQNSDPKDTRPQTSITETPNKTVIQEVLEELPENLSPLERSISFAQDEEPQPDPNSLHPNHSQHDGEHAGSENKKEEGDFPGQRLKERRLSADLTGCIFEKSDNSGRVGVENSENPIRIGRRTSILLPQESSGEPAATASTARRASILVKPDATKTGDKSRSRSASFLKTPMPTTTRSLSPNTTRKEKSQAIQVGNHILPAFVQVETLHPGQVFGLRACLDPEERGPSVSLVSGDCEVLQINKKFFMRHCDDAIYSLIRLKNKPFPTEEELIDRLDVNMQWEEYKHLTLHTFLRNSRSAKR